MCYNIIKGRKVLHMTYYARFSVIKEGYGLMGVEDHEFEADDLEDLKTQLDEFYEEKETKTVTYLLDELEDENGNDVKGDI